MLVLLVPAYRGPPRPVEGLLAAAADGFSASAPPRPSSSAPLQPTDGLRAGGLSPGLSDEEASLCFIGAFSVPLVGRDKERMNAIFVLGCLVGRQSNHHSVIHCQASVTRFKRKQQHFGSSVY